MTLALAALCVGCVGQTRTTLTVTNHVLETHTFHVRIVPEGAASPQFEDTYTLQGGREQRVEVDLPPARYTVNATTLNGDGAEMDVRVNRGDQLGLEVVMEAAGLRVSVIVADG